MIVGVTILECSTTTSLPLSADLDLASVAMYVDLKPSYGSRVELRTFAGERLVVEYSSMLSVEWGLEVTRRRAGR